MLFARRVWPVVVATGATLLISVGAVVTPNLRDQLGNPDELLVFLGSAAQPVALVGALASCVSALRGAPRTSTYDQQTGGAGPSHREEQS
jgi:hypothetical protein